MADKPDSHDICFVADGDNAGWLREKLGDRAPNHGGGIVDEAGEVLGEHEGTYGFTIGQRKGLRLGRARRRRQAALRARHRAGVRHRHRRSARAARRRPDQRRSGPLVRQRRPPRWTGPSSCAPTATSTAPRVVAHGDRRRRTIELLDPAYGIAPGQAAVIYDGTRVVGSATISATSRAS